MHIGHVAITALVLGATLALAGCGSTWVDADASGCSAQDVKQMTADGPHGMSEMMGNGICKAHGMQKFAGKWRCHANTLQVACS